MWDLWESILLMLTLNCLHGLKTCDKRTNTSEMNHTVFHGNLPKVRAWGILGREEDKEEEGKAVFTEVKPGTLLNARGGTGQGDRFPVM